MLCCHRDSSQIFTLRTSHHFGTVISFHFYNTYATSLLRVLLVKSNCIVHISLLKIMTRNRCTVQEPGSARACRSGRGKIEAGGGKSAYGTRAGSDASVMHNWCITGESIVVQWCIICTPHECCITVCAATAAKSCINMTVWPEVCATHSEQYGFSPGMGVGMVSVHACHTSTGSCWVWTFFDARSTSHNVLLSRFANTKFYPCTSYLMSYEFEVCSDNAEYNLVWNTR
jgi:hypothetical protein